MQNCYEASDKSLQVCSPQFLHLQNSDVFSQKCKKYKLLLLLLQYFEDGEW